MGLKWLTLSVVFFFFSFSQNICASYTGMQSLKISKEDKFSTKTLDTVTAKSLTMFLKLVKGVCLAHLGYKTVACHQEVQMDLICQTLHCGYTNGDPYFDFQMSCPMPQSFCQGYPK